MDPMDADLARENRARNDKERIEHLVREMGEITTPYDKAGQLRLRDLLAKLDRAQQEYGVAVKVNHGIA